MKKLNFNFQKISVRFITVLTLISLLFIVAIESIPFIFLDKVFVDQKLNDVRRLIKTNNEYLKVYTSALNRDVLGLVNFVDLLPDSQSIISSLYLSQSEHSTYCMNTVFVDEDDHVLSDKPHLLEISNTDIYFSLHQKTTSSPYRGVTLSEPYYSPLSLRDTIAICAPNQSGTKTVICEIDLLSMLKSITSENDEYYWILTSKQGYPLAMSTNIKASEKEEILENIINSNSTTLVNNEKCYVESLSKGPLDISIYALVPESLINDTTKQTKNIIGIIGGLMVIIIVFVSGLIGNAISKPMTKLSNKIKKAKQLSEVDLTEEKKRTDEIGVLANSLSNLNTKINNLLLENEKIAEERRLLEINALQAQIHPHFLGNTLACISSLIKSHHEQEAYNSTILLTKMMSYSIINTTSQTTLESELNATEWFLKLRLMRSPNLFSYEIFVPENHKNHPVPKLILQPIVENAIKHGFCEKNEGYNLSIYSYTKNKHLFLSINNNGKLIDQKRLHDIQTNNIQPSIDSHGIGLKNVFKRLKLNQKSSLGGKLTSNEKTGTTIILDLGTLSSN